MIWQSIHCSSISHRISSVQFGCSVVSDSLRPHGLQYTRLPCPSPTPGACSNSCLSSWRCHPTISSSVIPFSFCLQSFSLSSQSYGFSHSHVWIWELDYKGSWALKNWCFWTVVLGKTLESPLDCKEIKPVIHRISELRMTERNILFILSLQERKLRLVGQYLVPYSFFLTSV